MLNCQPALRKRLNWSDQPLARPPLSFWPPRIPEIVRVLDRLGSQILPKAVPAEVAAHHPVPGESFDHRYVHAVVPLRGSGTVLEREARGRLGEHEIVVGLVEVDREAVGGGAAGRPAAELVGREARSHRDSRKEVARVAVGERDGHREVLGELMVDSGSELVGRRRSQAGLDLIRGARQRGRVDAAVVAEWRLNRTSSGWTLWSWFRSVQ